MATEQEIIAKVVAHMQRNGGSNSDWYAGVTADPKVRLFSDHGVHQDGDAWIYEPAESEAAARTVESYLINTLATDGGPGGGTNPRYVYAYKKNEHTKP
jgi:hypothetical protein